MGMLIDAKFILTHKEHAGKVATNHRHKLLDVSWIDKSIESNRMIPLYRFLLQPPAGGFERFDSSARDLIEIMEHLIAGDVNGLYTSLHKQVRASIILLKACTNWFSSIHIGLVQNGVIFTLAIAQKFSL